MQNTAQKTIAAYVSKECLEVFVSGNTPYLVITNNPDCFTSGQYVSLEVAIDDDEVDTDELSPMMKTIVEDGYNAVNYDDCPYFKPDRHDRVAKILWRRGLRFKKEGKSLEEAQNVKHWR